MGLSNWSHISTQLQGVRRAAQLDICSVELYKRPPGDICVGCYTQWRRAVWGSQRETEMSVMWGSPDPRLWFVKVHQTGVDQNLNKSPQWHQRQNSDNNHPCKWASSFTAFTFYERVTVGFFYFKDPLQTCFKHEYANIVIFQSLTAGQDVPYCTGWIVGWVIGFQTSWNVTNIILLSLFMS